MVASLFFASLLVVPAFVFPVQGLHTHSLEASTDLTEDVSVPTAHVPLETDMNGFVDFMSSLVKTDMNGRSCVLCGMPLEERTDRNYTHRPDCGSQSLFENMQLSTVPVYDIWSNSEEPTTAWCELNVQVMCADAVYNKDFLFQAKAVDYPASQTFDPTYCYENGWLAPEFVALQHDFEAMDKMQKDICDTKYMNVTDWKAMTLLDMGSVYSTGMLRGYPTHEEANFIGAWTCAMGNAGCDMAYCAYSFCDLGGGTLGRYEECPGWDPVQGMPILQS